MQFRFFRIICLRILFVGLGMGFGSTAVAPDGFCENFEQIKIDRTTGVVTAVVTHTAQPVSDPTSFPYVSLDPTHVVNPSTKMDLTTGDSWKRDVHDVAPALSDPQTYQRAIETWWNARGGRSNHTQDNWLSFWMQWEEKGEYFNGLTASVVRFDNRQITDSNVNALCLSHVVHTLLISLSSYIKYVKTDLSFSGISVIDPLNPTSFQLTAARIFSTPTGYIGVPQYQRYITFGYGANTEPLNSKEIQLEVGHPPTAMSSANEFEWGSTLPFPSSRRRSMTFAVRVQDAHLQYAMGVAIAGFKVCRVSRSLVMTTQNGKKDSDSSKNLIPPKVCSAIAHPDQVYEVWDDYDFTPRCAQQRCIAGQAHPKQGRSQIDSHNTAFRSLLRPAVEEEFQKDVKPDMRLLEYNRRNWIRGGDGIALNPKVIVRSIGKLTGDQLYFVEARVAQTEFSADPIWLDQFDPSIQSRQSRKLLTSVADQESVIVVDQVTTTTFAYASNDCPHPRFDSNGLFLGCYSNSVDYTSPGFIALYVILSLILFGLIVWICYWAWSPSERSEWTSGTVKQQAGREGQTYEFTRSQ